MSIDYDKIENLAVKAWEGPWSVDYSASGKTLYLNNSIGGIIMEATGLKPGERGLDEETADYIASVPPNVVLSLIWTLKHQDKMIDWLAEYAARLLEHIPTDVSCVPKCGREDSKKSRSEGKYDICMKCIIRIAERELEEEDALKPCPCCGNVPTKDDVIDGGIEARPRVYCSNCGIAGPEAEYAYYEYAYKAWNALPRKTEKSE